MKRILILVLIVAFAGCSKKVVKSNEFGDSSTEYYVEEVKPEIKAIKKVVPVVLPKLNIQEKVYFDFDSETLTRDQMGVLDILIRMISDSKNCRVVLVGNACKIGTDEYNYRLGLRRGNSVYKYFALNLPHFSEGQIVISSNGEAGCAGRNETDYPQCRNCEITVTE